jgi:hypothetical protein
LKLSIPAVDGPSQVVVQLTLDYDLTRGREATVGMLMRRTGTPAEYLRPTAYRLEATSGTTATVTWTTQIQPEQSAMYSFAPDVSVDSSEFRLGVKHSLIVAEVWEGS